MIETGGQAFSIDLLINKLEQNSVPFEIIQNSSWLPNYKFASIKNVVSGGVYFFEDVSIIKNYDIHDSILIVSEQIETNNNLIVVSNPQLVHYLINAAINNI